MMNTKSTTTFGSMSNGHNPQAEQELFNNLLSDDPCYNPPELAASAYADKFTRLRSIRQKVGLNAAMRAFDDFKTNDPAFAQVMNGKKDKKPPTEQHEPTQSDPFKLDGKFSLPQSAALDAALGKDACAWLDAYIAFSRKWSPRGYEGFHEAVALWLLSTVAARRVSISFGREEFTPLLLLLVATTTTKAKTETARIGYDVLDRAGLRWLLGADNTTPQKLISDMSGSRVPSGYEEQGAEDRARIENRLAMSGQRGWYYEEFGQHMDAMVKKDGVMSDFKGLLRQLDDCQSEYSSSTISRGSDVVKNPYLALLGTMTPSDMKPYAGRDSKFWRDGLFPRFGFIVAPNTPGKRDRFPDEDRIIPQDITFPLVEWHRRLAMTPIDIQPVLDKDGKTVRDHRIVRGDLPANRCTLSQGVKDAYYNYDDALAAIADELNVEWVRGNYARFPKKALRIAMLLASLENNGVIELKHWARAQEITERWRTSLHELDRQINECACQEVDEMEEKILNLLVKKGQALTAREVAQGVWGLDTAEATRKLDLLVKSGEVHSAREGKKVIYTLPPSVDGVDGVEV